MTRARDSLVYATAFFIGEFDRAGGTRGGDAPAVPGSYATSIRIHNPDPQRAVKITLTATAQFEGGEETRRGKSVEVELAAGGVMFIDGAYLRDGLLKGGKGSPPLPAPLFVNGILAVDSAALAPLDVIAVYTIQSFTPGGGAGGSSMQVQRAAGVLIEQPSKPRK